MNVQEHGRQVAKLKALLNLITAEYNDARAGAAAAYAASRIGSLTVVLPDGTEVGSVTVKAVGVVVIPEDAVLLEWAKVHTPSEVEEFLDDKALTDEELLGWAREHRDDLIRERIRPVWHAELIKKAAKNGGHAVDPITGAAHKFAEVRHQPVTGEFVYTPKRIADEAILSAVTDELAALKAGLGLTVTVGSPA